MSLDITKRIILSAENTKPNVRISIKQGCINTVTLLVSINNHGGLLEFPVGSTAKVRMLKPDGNQVLNDCSISGNNTVNVVFTEQMQAYPGDGLCEVIILSGAKRLTSATFPVYIEPTVHDDSQLESLPEYTSLINALVAVDGKMDKQGDSADNIVTFEEAAEDADITSGEKHSAIFGKLLKSIKTLRSGKINKTDIIQNDTVGGVDKVASGELVKTHRQDIGTLSSLKTTNKTSLVAAINEQNDNLVNFAAMYGGSFSADTYTFFEAVTNIYNALPRDNTIYSVTFRCGAAYAAIIQRYSSTYGCAIVFGYGIDAPKFYRLSGGIWTQHSFSIT